MARQLNHPHQSTEEKLSLVDCHVKELSRVTDTYEVLSSKDRHLQVLAVHSVKY
jgi:hypothetical protein